MNTFMSDPYCLKYFNLLLVFKIKTFLNFLSLHTNLPGLRHPSENDNEIKSRHATPKSLLLNLEKSETETAASSSPSVADPTGLRCFAGGTAFLRG